MPFHGVVDCGLRGCGGATHSKALGVWVHNQREAKRGKGSYKLTQKRIDELDGLGFDWGKEKKHQVARVLKRMRCSRWLAV